MAVTKDQMNGVHAWLRPRLIEWSVRAGYAFKVHTAVAGRPTITSDQLNDIVINDLKARPDVVLMRVLHQALDPQEHGVLDCAAFEVLVRELLMGKLVDRGAILIN
jgi:hypothetical protein